MKTQYLKDRQQAIEQLNQQATNEILTEEKLSTLPVALQNHFRNCGFIGRPIAMNADIVWKESYIKLAPGQKWKSLQTLQFNAVNPIMRTAFMKVNNMFFTGKDLYKNGQGSMIGKILNLFTVINAKGKEISQSALITSFCEMMLLSGYAFQDYIKWKAIDKQTIEATLSDHQFEVSGTFYFDETGKFKYFETNDRYFDAGKGNFVKKKFASRVTSYQEIDGLTIPEQAQVLWYLDGKEYCYFKGTIERINFNVKS